MLRTIIVDDEELARRVLRQLLQQIGDVDVVAECESGTEAIDAIGALAPDLAYLDVQMPEKTGFEVIEALDGPHCPHVVFVTAFDSFAVRAFEVHALDYLLKPINEARLAESVGRARAATGHAETMLQRFANASADLRQYFAPLAVASFPDRLTVKTREGLVLVNVEDIDWVEADGDYVSLHAGKKAYLLHETITWAQTRLSRAGFLRIHRSTLVNGNRVRELRPLSKGEYTVVLVDGAELKLSRNYRETLDRLVGRDA
jgi:two-component system LytT family response regulator